MSFGNSSIYSKGGLYINYRGAYFSNCQKIPQGIVQVCFASGEIYTSNMKITETKGKAHLLQGGLYPYRSSKAGLNAVTKSLSLDLAPLQVK